MSEKTRSWTFVLIFVFELLWVSATSASTVTADVAPSAPDPVSVSARLDRLEARLQSVEAEVTKLRQEKQALEAALENQTRETASMARKSAESIPATDRRPEVAIPSTHWGARIGYQGFPYGQREGGVMYGVFLDHRLLAESDGVPFGDLDTEIGVNVARSGIDHLRTFSQVQLQQVRIEYRQVMLSGWLGLKYYFDRWAPLGVRPYLTGGPGIWGDVIESPPFVIGQTPISGKLALRKLPIDAAASIYEGAQGGAGLEYSLARTRIPIIERLHLAFDYRYSAWTTGQRFSSYSLGVSLAD
jgi:cell division protein FtsB